MLSGGVGPAAVVLLVVFAIGVAVGRSKRRWGLLLIGIIAIAVIGFTLTTSSTGMVTGGAEDVARLYSTAVPLVVFVAGWLCARGSWFTRVVVVAAVALLLAVFPYPSAGRATADLLARSSAAAPAGS